jgi:Tol biopolymer transport system component
MRPFPRHVLGIFKETISNWYLVAFLAVILLGPQLSFGQTTRDFKKISNDSANLPVYLPEAESFENLKLNDGILYQDLYVSGQAIAESFINFIFPVSGKEKRVEFLPYQYWGQKKPKYKKLIWKKTESQHFVFYSYGEEDELLMTLIRIYESRHEPNSEFVGVDNRIQKKIPILLYRSRSDFEQTSTIPDIVPESLGGFTEVMSWRRVIFPFEGDKTTFEHVSRHEGTHLYHVAKRPGSMPLWFIEGLAETNSIKWDANAETTIRDAYFNNYILHIEDLWQVYGSWLMYKQGNYITNFIVDNFGSDSIRKLYDSSTKLPFDKNLKQNLGLDLKELDAKMFAKLNAKYGPLGKNRDDIDNSHEIVKGKLLGAKGDYFVSGLYKDGRFEIYLNYIDTKIGLVTRKIINDFDSGNESLHSLKGRVGLGDGKLAYSIDSGPKDVIRIVDFYYSAQKSDLSTAREMEFSWDSIPRILDPLMLGRDKLAFIGFENDYSGIYIYDIKTKKLEKITKDKSYYRGIDYNQQRNIIVFSKEEERIAKPCRYNFNLYSYNLSTKEFKKLTDSEYNDFDPSISPDGSKIAFVGDKDDTYNIFLYDLDNGKVVQATDVKVAAFTPRWVDNEKIYLGTIKKFESFIYKMRVPTLKIAFSKNLPVPAKAFYTLNNGNFVIATDSDPGQRDNEIEFKNKFVIKGSNLSVLDGKRKYEVKNFVAHQGSLTLLTEPAELNSWEKSKDEVIFAYENGKLERMSRAFGFAQKLDSTIQNIIGAFKKDKSVISTFVSPDGTLIYILVNNVLSFEKKKAEQSLYVIDTKTAKITEMPYYKPLSTLRDNITKLYFLSGAKTVIEVQRRDWEGDEYKQYYIHDQKIDKFNEFDVGTGMFNISLDSRYVINLNDDHSSGQVLELYDSNEDKRKVLTKIAPGFVAVETSFIENNMIFVGLLEKAGDRVGIIYVDISGKPAFEKYLKVTAGYRFVHAKSSSDGQYAALKIRDTRTKTGIEKLYFYQRGEDLLKEIGTDLSYYDKIEFVKGTVVFEGRDLDDFANLYAFGKSEISKGYKIDSSGYSDSSNKLVISGSEDLMIVDLEKGGVKRIIDKTLGFDVYKDNIIISSFVDGFYNLFVYDIPKSSLIRLTKSWFNELNPKISSKGIAYTADEGKRFSIHLRSSLNEDKIERIYLDKSDVYNPVWDKERLYFNIRESIASSEMDQKVSEPLRPDLWTNIPLDTTLKVGKVPNNLRPEYLLGGVAYDGRNALIFLSLTADNIFSDRGLFANIVYKSDFINSVIGYTNIEMGRTYSLYLNKLDNNSFGGFSFQKTYLLDKFREFDLFAGFEFQKFKPDQFRGDNQDFPDQVVTQYILKSGAVYAYDATIWDYHGPIKGGKYLAKSELGINLQTGKVSSVDANVDLRFYNQIVSRVGFAHRFMAGTSQGPYPTIYFLGGNISFRGVPFDGLECNNYWVFSEDLRIPFFDILGGKLPDPVDSAIGPFFRFFDVRGGLYLDMGQVWFNKFDDIENILYSFGMFINTPTLFGMTLRFSKGFLGQSGFNFWFGYNW